MPVTASIAIKTGLAASAASLAIMSGSAMAAPPPAQDTYTPDLATTLSLPVGKIVHYYNRATNMAMRERCEAGADKSVSCNLDVFGITAGLVHKVQTKYAADQTGHITAQSTKVNPKLWSSSDHLSAYKDIKASALMPEWGSGSPLARVAQNQGRQIIQNSIGEISSYGDKGVALCSVVPVSEKRGIDVCLAFDRGSNEVRSVALPRLETAGALNAALTEPQAAIRDFNERLDSRRLLDYKATLPSGGGPAYILRKD